MEFTLGNLKFSEAALNPDLLASPVFNSLQSLEEVESIGVSAIDPLLSDTAKFCEHYQISMGDAANCVILEAKRGGASFFAACLILGDTRADINGLARKTLDARKVSFAKMEDAVRETGMEYGAITPIGLPSSWPILIDKAVIDSPCVIIGSGLRKSKIALPGKLLKSLPGVLVLDSLGQKK